MLDEGTAVIADEAALPQEEAEPIGPFQMDDAGLLKQLLAWFKEAADALVEERKKRKIDWRFYAGDQWEQDDRAGNGKADAKRPKLTLNLVLSIISAVAGEERTNRQEMKFYGEGQEDDKGAYRINRIVKWIMDQCGGQFSLSKQFLSMLVCGEGWVVPEVDYFEDPNGKIKLLVVDEEEMYPDPLDTDETAGGSRHLTRVRMMSEDEGNARWPGFKEKVRQSCLERGIGPETDGSGTGDIYAASNDTKSPKLYDARRKMWAVMETWWHQIEPGWIVVNEETNLLEEKTDEEFQAMKAEREQAQKDWLTSIMAPPPMPAPGQNMTAMPMPAPNPAAPPIMGPSPAMGAPAMGPPPMAPAPKALQATQRPIRRFYQAFWAHDTLLESKPSPLPRLKRFPYVAFRALYDKANKEWFGITRPILDPQRQHNVEQSTIVELIQLMPKASWMAPKGAYHDKPKWETGLATPGTMLEYNAQRGKPEAISPPPVPRHLIDMAFQRPQSMREISGVNVEMTGQRQGSDPGVVMEQRQKAAKTVLAPIFDGFRQTKMQLGRVILAYIQAYITVGRQLRVLGPEGAEYVPMTEDMAEGDFDLTVDETNETVNDRIATLTIMQTTLPTLMKAGIPVPASFIDMLPMPPHIRDEWKRMVSWQLLTSGQLPPPGWQPGQPDPRTMPPPGLAPPAAPQPAPPAQ
jgi:hypothetical protein